MKAAIDLLVRGPELSAELMREVMLSLMRGEADPAAVGAFLTALTIKGESVAEVTAAAQVMRALAKPADLGDGVLVDPVGTGGDGASLFNVSTAAAIVASAGGVKIAKHGNVAASSASGSADVLRQAGVVVDLEPAQVKACIAETNFGFMFAQAYHQPAPVPAAASANRPPPSSAALGGYAPRGWTTPATPSAPTGGNAPAARAATAAVRQ